jgi:glycylpeptide N-tetradecanoyltransferase
VPPQGHIPGHLHRWGCATNAGRDVPVGFDVWPSSFQLTLNRYYHRSINVRKLVDVKFMPVLRNQTLARIIRLNKLPATPYLADSRFGLREMEDRDVPEVADLFSRYSERFDLVPVMSLAEARHQFLSGSGRGEIRDGRREGQVTWSYVVEVNGSLARS